MEGSSAKKSTSLETLVIQNITNVIDLKSKLKEIIQTGKDYEYDVSSCVKSLLNNNDQEIVVLAVEAVSELVKCEDKRETYAQREIIEPILKILDREVTIEKLELVKQCCRALGNLCCDCDTSRKIILESNGVVVLRKLLEKSLDLHLSEIEMLVAKTLLNYGIGGQEFCQSMLDENILKLLERVLHIELEKEHIDDDIPSTAVLLLNVITDNIAEVMFSEGVNKAVLKVLKETASVEISELCLDILHAQAEHDSVKMLLANEGGVQLVCSRLEQLMARREAGEFSADDTEIEAVVKQACDLIIIVLTGDEAMHLLYANGSGEVYGTVVRWLHSPHHHLLSTAVLAVGNFARNDEYCVQMMENHIYDTLLDLFEKHHAICVEAAAAGGEGRHATVVCHGAAAALRNLCVSGRVAPHTADRAGRLLAKALTTVTDHLVAYKLLGALRMLVDTHECVARHVACHSEVAAAVARWGGGGGGAGAEAPRLLAWTVRRLAHTAHKLNLVKVEGCVSSLVNMLLSSHSLMQNEATLALTLLALECLKKDHTNFDPTHTNFDSTQTNFDSTQTNFDSTQTNFDSTQTNFDTIQTNFDSTQTNFDSTQTNFDSTQTNFDSTQTNFDLTQTNFDSTQTNSDSNQANVDLTPNNFDSVQPNFDPAQTNIDSTQTNFDITQTNFDITQTNFDSTQTNFNLAQSFTSQLIKAEIGKHVAILVDTNCAKMPTNVAVNLLAFLDITSKKNEIATDYKQARVNECLQKFSDTRNDFSERLKACIAAVIKDIANGE